jgi:Derlin-2/3
VATSVAVYGGLLPGQYIIFYGPWIYGKFPPQIWRLVTSFLLTGPQLGMIFDPFMLWNYGSGLEKDSPRFTRKGDFFVFVAFVALVILVSHEASYAPVMIVVILFL